ncbi:MAG: transketolase C-terminal domain-containing protein [Chloroflexota bacterium]|nr:transketolase C-terminal domain-containing protein [Chloroflexota bacterium]MDP6758085.1 transketolase C-terminal domain-containing protein [Chloroflexota bacterium]
MMAIGDMISCREAFGKALVEAGERDPNVVVLDADLGSSTQAAIFKDSFPERFYQVGIAEQNMIGMAAGMASVGLVPFTSTFACFTGRRVADQVSISVAFPRFNVKLLGAYAGIPAGKTGATHQAFEDLAILRAIPDMVVICPADGAETRQVVLAAVEFEGPVYIRSTREVLPVLFDDDYKFEIGKAVTLREGEDVGLITTGIMAHKVLEAADQLQTRGISAHVLHLPTLKPLDVPAIIDVAQRFDWLITVENHGIIGGLGSAIAETVTEHAPVRVHRIGIRDHFGESGDDEALFTKFGMNVEHIVAAATAR